MESSDQYWKVLADSFEHVCHEWEAAYDLADAACKQWKEIANTYKDLYKLEKARRQELEKTNS